MQWLLHDYQIYLWNIFQWYHFYLKIVRNCFFKSVIDIFIHSEFPYQHFLQNPYQNNHFIAILSSKFLQQDWIEDDSSDKNASHPKIVRRISISENRELFSQERQWSAHTQVSSFSAAYRRHTDRYYTRVSRGLVDVKLRKQIIWNPRFEREIKLVRS